MAGSTVDYSSALEDCLIGIGLGEDLGACIARHPEHAEQLRPYLETIIKMRQSSGSDRQKLIDIPADVSFNVALNHSIQMIMRGKTPVYCYTQYPEYAAQLPYRVVDTSPEFLAPDYSDPELKQSRIPDLRNTIYWNPTVKASLYGSDILEFWTSDQPGTYTIDLEGISPAGEKISLQKSFIVK